jgi:cation transport ATPase
MNCQGYRTSFGLLSIIPFGVPIAAGILYPFFGILLRPVFAAAAMNFSSVSVVANSLRLRKVKI